MSWFGIDLETVTAAAGGEFADRIEDGYSSVCDRN